MKTKIAKAIRRIYSVALNHWVSVREQPISKILEEEGVNRRYLGVMSEVLKAAGLLFTEGERSAMKYKFKTALVDADLLAERIIELEKERQEAYRASRPKRNKEDKPYGSGKGKTSFIKKEPLALGTKVYFMYEESIIEGIIYGSQLSDKPNKLYEYTLKFTYNNEIQYAESNYCSSIFLKPEEVTEYLIKNIIKYDTELVAQEIIKKHESTQSL